MSTQLIPFSFESHEIRVANDERGVVWFVAKDVADALDVSWKGSDTLASIKDEWKGVRKFRTPRGEQELTVILAQAVYKLAFRSRKPEAERFTDWAAETIATIHKTGQHVVPSEKLHGQAALDCRLCQAANSGDHEGVTRLATEAFQALTKGMERMWALEKKIADMQEKVDFYDLIVGSDLLFDRADAAKLLRVNEKLLWAKMLEWGSIQADGTPTQRNIEARNFRLVPVLANKSGHSAIAYQQTMVTAKGLARINELIGLEKSVSERDLRGMGGAS